MPYARYPASSLSVVTAPKEAAREVSPYTRVKIGVIGYWSSKGCLDSDRPAPLCTCHITEIGWSSEMVVVLRLLPVLIYNRWPLPAGLTVSTRGCPVNRLVWMAGPHPPANIIKVRVAIGTTAVLSTITGAYPSYTSLLKEWTCCYWQRSVTLFEPIETSGDPKAVGRFQYVHYYCLWGASRSLALTFSLLFFSCPF